MKNNVIIIVLDSLSKWHIDQIKDENNFFTYIENNSYCAANMYSGSPFTEAAIRAMWESRDAVTGRGMLGGLEGFGAIPFFELFQKNGYKDIYMDYPMLLTADALSRRGIYGNGWVGNTVLDRLRYYSGLKKKGELQSRDYGIIEIWLDHWFDIFRNREHAESEHTKYLKDKKCYINHLLDDGIKQEYFRDAEGGALANYYILRAEKAENEKVLDAERKLESLIQHKNIQYMMQTNHHDKETVNSMLGLETYNKELATGINVLHSMRMPFGNAKEDFEDFWNWHDGRADVNAPFLAYIHNSSFHLPENFMDARYGDDGYEAEVLEKIKETEALPFKKMSVMKQLSINNISKNLEKFWTCLSKRKMLENTYVVITADHGSANTIYCRPESKWNYTRRIFQVPFYMAGADIVPTVDYGFHTALDLLPTLIDKCGLDTYGSQYMGHTVERGGDEYAFSTWVHGAFDLYRQEIKMGIRNNRYSINCTGYATQFFGSCRLTACDLEADPDEAYDVYESVRKRKDFLELFGKLRMKWFETIYSILTDRENPWDFSERYGFLAEKRNEYMAYNDNQKEYSKEQFMKQLREKQVVLTGTDEELEMFLKTYGSGFRIREVWDADFGKKGGYLFGHRINIPHAVTDQDDTLFIVTSRRELEAKEQLDHVGIKEYLFWRLVH